MVGAVIIISEKADRKLVNRLLLHLRDDEYGDEEYDPFQLITSMEPLVKGSEGTPTPIKDFDNKWAGKTMRDTELFMMQQDEGETGGPHCPDPFNFLVLDDRGIEERTIILTERDSDYTKETGVQWRDTFQKMRLPWDRAFSVWCNLDIANMNYDEFIDHDKGVDKDGYHVFHLDQPLNPAARAASEKEAAEARARIDAAVEEMGSSDEE